MPIPVIMPKLEMSQESALLLRWLKKPGDQVAQGEPLLEVETEKITMDIEATASGILADVRVKEGETVPVTSVIAYLLQPGESMIAIIDQPIDNARLMMGEYIEGKQAITEVGERDEKLLDVLIPGMDGRKLDADIVESLRTKRRATPAARRAAREMNIDIRGIAGSGAHGRIQEMDVVQSSATMPQESASTPGGNEVVRLSNIRRTIAQKMLTSHQEIPVIHFTNRVDTARLDCLRKQLNERVNTSAQAHVSMTALLVKAVAHTLTRHLWINSSLHGEEIIINKKVNVGIAVSIPEGVIVPVIQQAQNKPIDDIAREVNDLSNRARRGNLVPGDLTGGTFTISNLGPYGIEQFTAIINPGQTGILAVAAAIPQPAVVNGNIEVRNLMTMTLAVDHRVVDGAIAAQFMSDLKKALEGIDPMIFSLYSCVEE